MIDYTKSDDEIRKAAFDATCQEYIDAMKTLVGQGTKVIPSMDDIPGETPILKVEAMLQGVLNGMLISTAKLVVATIEHTLLFDRDPESEEEKKARDRNTNQVYNSIKAGLLEAIDDMRKNFHENLENAKTEKDTHENSGPGAIIDFKPKKK